MCDWGAVGCLGMLGVGGRGLCNMGVGGSDSLIRRRPKFGGHPAKELLANGSPPAPANARAARGHGGRAATLTGCSMTKNVADGIGSAKKERGLAVAGGQAVGMESPNPRPNSPPRATPTSPAPLQAPPSNAPTGINTPVASGSPQPGVAGVRWLSLAVATGPGAHNHPQSPTERGTPPATTHDAKDGAFPVWELPAHERPGSAPLFHASPFVAVN